MLSEGRPLTLTLQAYVIPALLTREESVEVPPPHVENEALLTKVSGVPLVVDRSC